MQIFKLLIGLTLLSLIILSCEKEKIVYCDIEDTGKVTVAGTVFAVKCPNGWGGSGVSSNQIHG
ncbi:MAG: hypothetical protein ABIJ45_07800 [Candidatus Zixiibacteriota bacterium]